MATTQRSAQPLFTIDVYGHEGHKADLYRCLRRLCLDLYTRLEFVWNEYLWFMATCRCGSGRNHCGGGRLWTKRLWSCSDLLNLCRAVPSVRGEGDHPSTVLWKRISSHLKI